MRSPAAVHGRACRSGYDTMTLVGPGSWEAIRGAVDAALTAADLVSSGAPLAYALCRAFSRGTTPPPAPTAVPATSTTPRSPPRRCAPPGARQVAVIDIDAHHGNGTQMIFYDRADVWYGSLHVDPGAGWFPHYAWDVSERGRGAGQGSNRNLPLAPGHRGRRVARRAGHPVRGGVRHGRRCRRGVARAGRGGRRPGEPAAGVRGRLPRGGPPGSPPWRWLSWSRRAGMTFGLAGRPGRRGARGSRRGRARIAGAAGPELEI